MGLGNAITRLLFGRRAEADRQAIPTVDGNDGQRQVDQFFVSKLFAYCCIQLMRSSIKDFSHRKVTDSGTFGYTMVNLYHILCSVLSPLR